jgi:predicted nuclease of predicted toxin-antitoxin system
LRFLLDMGIAAKVALWLKTLDHDAIHLNDEGLFQLQDKQIIEKAVQEKRIILTSDMDFGHILSLNHISSVSVIQFRTSDFTPNNIIAKLELLFIKFANQLDGEFIITVEDNRIRFRKLPI